MEHRPTGRPQDHPNYNTTVTSANIGIRMLTSGYAPGTEPIARPPNALDDPEYCAGCGTSTNGAQDWKKRHLHLRNECKLAYQNNTCRFPKIPAPLPASDPNGDNTAHDDYYGDYDAYANNALAGAVSYDTQQSLYPQASSSTSQAESYYPATTTGTTQGGQYSSTTDSVSQDVHYYPAISSASQGQDYTTTSQYRGSGSRGYRRAGNKRRD
ncbi:uncharacterized protein Bfra_009743 [Botrytis fragariae]|uniref:Uncharacterized protein n=1 Tax=Botrytis fragariae TaxID=1964551 RepID=A0A8H6EFE2_9HELO|nr:uncharacterized protein Bfra_009743 [Botrytis fragariae]KAF5870359.1 hypothetical protein Bfra_009743 [Botrytis fragariae]